MLSRISRVKRSELSAVARAVVASISASSSWVFVCSRSSVKRLRFLRLRLELLRLLLQRLVEHVELVRALFRGCARRRLGGEPHGLQLRRPTLGQVSRHLRESDHLAVRIAQRSDDHVRPEPRAVLPEAPSLVLEPPIAGGAAQLHLRLPVQDVLARVERGEVPADDLVRLIPLQLFCADVPGEDLAARVEREDGVVANAGDEKAIQLGGFVRTLTTPGIRR